MARGRHRLISDRFVFFFLQQNIDSHIAETFIKTKKLSKKLILASPLATGTPTNNQHGFPKGHPSTR